MQQFPKQKRILTPKQFRTVFQSAKKLSGQKFALLTRRNNKTFPRLGFALAKKQIPLAVNRNKLKRLFRESFRRQTQLPPVDIVIIAYRSLDKLPNQQVAQSIEMVWNSLVKHYNTAS